MILTVTLNPLLERRLNFNSIKTGEINRANNKRFSAGGKGINVSRQLNKLGIANIALTFLGGNNGKILRRILNEEEIQFKAVNQKSETRAASIHFDESNSTLTTFMDINSEITSSEADDFLDQLKKMIPNSSMIIFSGSSPSEKINHIFAEGIKLANEYDKISILDSYGDHFEKCLSAKPMIIHTNKDEAEQFSGRILTSDQDFCDYLEYIYGKGIKISTVTNGSKSFFASKFGFKLKITPPKIETKDPIGSGDSFVAGLIYGFDNSLVFEETIRIAAAAGAANASTWQTAASEKDVILELAKKVDVESVGKKMKTLDDRPNY
ncbi:MAG: hexose kinase [Melioribacteraceae bacterium]|nr:hexose kinase [Melioribacteraceae bacterium]MCF8431858.1 hexose kinase [Melioribacteraceae bacterium]